MRWFGSFDVATGLRVRAVAGPEARIFTWSAVSDDELVQAVDAQLDLGVGDFATLERVSVGSGGGTPVRVHLKIDTGLHRSGVRPEEWADFVARAAAAEASGTIVVAGIWSHIAETSDTDDDRARAEFDRAVDVARAAGLKPEVRHLAASAAAHARPEFRYDLVRFGAFAYGVRSAGSPLVDGIEPAATLLAPVTAVGDDTVEIGIGALDGLPSTLSGRVSVRAVAGARPLRVGPRILDRRRLGRRSDRRRGRDLRSGRRLGLIRDHPCRSDRHRGRRDPRPAVAADPAASTWAEASRAAARGEPTRPCAKPHVRAAPMCGSRASVWVRPKVGS